MNDSPSTLPQKPLVLCILDGWGHRDDADDNAISEAYTPNWHKLLEDCPHTLIEASEHFVGLPDGQMGNSEVGHMNIGGGRVILQDLPRIDKAFKDHAIQELPQWKSFIANLQKTGGACHLMGLLSPGGVHSHMDHILQLCTFLNDSGIKTWIHGFLDGRDTPPKSGLEYLKTVLKVLENLPHVNLGTFGGRYYGMDRDSRWERIEPAVQGILKGLGPRVSDPLAALQSFYDQGITDEFIPHQVMEAYAGAQGNDGLLMGNFRTDRARQILTVLLKKHSWKATLGMSEYSQELAKTIPALFPPIAIRNCLGEVISSHNLKQLRLAETEKYAHVTFFFNGGQEDPFPGEDRILIPSPKVATYDLKPEMSAFEITKALETALPQKNYSLIVMNYANADMVGHTGNMEASKKAIEVLDTCLGRVRQACESNGYILMITADHGNVEQMQDHQLHSPHTAHTCNQVPLIVSGGPRGMQLHPGTLGSLAPTILDLMGLPTPQEMTESSLCS